MTKYKVGLLAGAFALVSAAVFAAGFFTNGLPGAKDNGNTWPPTGSEAFPLDTNLAGGAAPQSEGMTLKQAAKYFSGQLGSEYQGNYLTGGDAGSNLWQRGTTGAAVTTTSTYGGPDRWFYWSGTGTEVKVIRSSTAGDLPTGYQYAFKFARTNSQTGVVQACFAQEVETALAISLAGSTAEFDFHAVAGSGFSAASSNIVAYVVTGTAADEGSSKLAFGLNAGGGGSTGWTGQANAVAATIPISTVNDSTSRYTVVAAIPTGELEIAVALCYTPVGTATSDYVAFSGLQLVKNTAVSDFASATVYYTPTTIPALPFIRKPLSVETAAQYRYYYQLNDPAATVRIAPCQVTVANTTIRCLVELPQPMRVAPTVTAPGSNTAFAITASDGSANVCTALTVTPSSTYVANVTAFTVDCTPTSNIAVTVPSQLIGDATAFTLKASAEL